MKHQPGRPRRASLRARWCAAAMLGCCALGPTPVAVARVFTPYEVFHHLSEAELATVQIRLVWLGDQLVSVGPVTLYAAGEAPDANLFVPFHRPGFREASDFGDEKFRAPLSITEVATVVSPVGGLATVVDGNVAEDPRLSFSILDRSPSIRVFDSVLGEEELVSFFARLGAALSENPAASRVVQRMACSVGALEAERPRDITSLARVRFGPLRRDFPSHRFFRIATVANTAVTSLPVPLSLVLLGGSSSTQVANAVGTTCRVQPYGRPYITVATPAGGLAPGRSVEVRVEFANPDMGPVTPVAKLLAGPGAR